MALGAAPIPGAIEQLQRRFDEFRSTQPHRTRLPETLWAGYSGAGAGIWSASGCSAFTAGLYGVEEAFRRSSGSTKEDIRARIRRTDRCASDDGGGARDRVRVLVRRQDAHSVEEFLCAGLGRSASRLAGIGAMIHVTAQMRVLAAIEPVDAGRSWMLSLWLPSEVCVTSIARWPVAPGAALIQTAPAPPLSSS